MWTLKKHNLANPGFTLIELMVVIAIVGILSTVALVNMGKNEDRDIRNEAQRLTSFLRSVQHKALAGEYVATSNKVCGFGAHKVSGSELAAYYIPAPDLDTSCADIVDKSYSDANKLDSFNFLNGVTVGDFEDLFFLSPNGEVSTLDPNGFPEEITLTKNGISIGDIIIIEETGRIY